MELYDYTYIVSVRVDIPLLMSSTRRILDGLRVLYLLLSKLVGELLFLCEQ